VLEVVARDDVVELAVGEHVEVVTGRLDIGDRGLALDDAVLADVARSQQVDADALRRDLPMTAADVDPAADAERPERERLWMVALVDRRRAEWSQRDETARGGCRRPAEDSSCAPRRVVESGRAGEEATEAARGRVRRHRSRLAPHGA
jgi:hypothetical protein